MISAEDLKKELRLVAENDGDAYRAQDASLAIHMAFHDYVKRNTNHLWEEFTDIQDDLVKELEDDWRKTYNANVPSDL